MYTMMQACKEVNMTYAALKFYCNAGLIPNVKRDKNNRRIFDENNINWIKSLSCLKNCGMSIKDMQVYLDLCLQGPKTIPERQDILNVQKEKLLNQLEEIQKSLEYIDHKQQFYQDVLDEKIEYQSYLIDTTKHA